MTKVPPQTHCDAPKVKEPFGKRNRPTYIHARTCVPPTWLYVIILLYYIIKHTRYHMQPERLRSARACVMDNTTLYCEDKYIIYTCYARFGTVIWFWRTKWTKIYKGRKYLHTPRRDRVLPSAHVPSSYPRRSKNPKNRGVGDDDNNRYTRRRVRPARGVGPRRTVIIANHRL